MHVLLIILKIIGIILLVILGILLFLLLVFLFVPLRYRLQITRQNEVLEANGTMTWLLHFLRADLTYKEKKGIAVVRVCGFKVKTFHYPKEEEPPKEVTAEESAAQEDTPADAREEGAAAQIEEAGRHEAESSGEAAGRTEADSVSEASGESPAEEKHSGDRALFRNLTDLITRFVSLVLELLLQIPGLPAEVQDRIEQVLDQIQKKTDTLFRKIDPFFSIEAEHMLGKMIGYVKYLIRGYRPRKISGFIHFGTGSPDVTGWLTGLIYVLLPESGTEYDVDPDFYETVLETDTRIRGHIRMYRFSWVGLRLVMDREFRTLYRAIRGKDKNSGHRGSRRARRKALKEKAGKAA